MALENHFVFSHQPCFENWDPHFFAFGDHEAEQLSLSATQSPMSSSDASTGYLQDAVADWSERSKRRRVGSSAPLHNSVPFTEDLQDIFQGFWDSSFFEDPMESLNYLLHDNIFNSGDPLKLLEDNKTHEFSSSTTTEAQKQPVCSSSSSFDEPQHSKDVENKKDDYKSKDARTSLLCPSVKALTFKESYGESIEHSKDKKQKATTGVAYPFAVVKPGGFDGDVTLDDINTRILMRPSRPVRHPVGEFACSPCEYADGLGPSGKEVVSLTRIQTSGRGTITIIRTRG